jgi:hypothetical protein
MTEFLHAAMRDEPWLFLAAMVAAFALVNAGLFRLSVWMATRPD